MNMFYRKNHCCEHSGMKTVMAIIVGVFAAIGMVGSILLMKEKLCSDCSCGGSNGKKLMRKLKDGAEDAVQAVKEKVEDCME